MFAAKNLLLTASAPVTPVTFDAAANAPYQNLVGTTTSPITWSHTVAAGGPYGIVVIWNDNSFNTMSPTEVDTVTFGGITLTSLGALYVNNTSSNGFIRVFGGNGIPSGSQTVGVTFPSGKTLSGWLGSLTYNNVTSVDSLQTSFGSSGSGSLSVPSQAGSRVFGSIIAYNSGGAVVNFTSFSLTQRQIADVNAEGPSQIDGDAAGASIVTVSANFTSNTWAAVGLNMK